MQDPLASDLKALCDASDTPEATVRAVLNVKEVFGESLAGNEKVLAATTQWLTRINEQGVLAALKAELT